MIRRITVLGAGTMGHGIAHAAASAGFATRLHDISEDSLSMAQVSIERIVGQAVDLGKLQAADADAILGRLETTASLPSALDGADFVIEAVPERIDVKIALLAEVDRLAPSRAVIATN